MSRSSKYRKKGHLLNEKKNRMIKKKMPNVQIRLISVCELIVGLVGFIFDITTTTTTKEHRINGPNAIFSIYSEA